MFGIILGFKVQSLKILPVGFSVSFKIDIKNYNKKILNANFLTLKKTIVAMAGPCTNLICIAIILLCNTESIFNIQNDILIYTNILIFIFNMLPIYPLDGGRVIKNILHIFLGKIISLKCTNIISNITAMFLSILIIYLSIIYKNLLYIFILGYILMIIIKENKIYKMKIHMLELINNILK